MRGKAGKFSFAIFLAWVLFIGALSLTAFFWYKSLSYRINIPTEKSAPIMSLRDIPIDGKSTPNVAPLTYPESIN
ncbi:MAG TPA: hypothetical protein PLR77_04950, partial [Caldisericia bacterium]|nr:hypothetical protein [Caldisericia bacterium]